MNGRRYFLDTNAIVQLLSGNPSILETISEAEYIATSVICEVEFFSFSGLTEEDRKKPLFCGDRPAIPETFHRISLALTLVL